MHESPELAVQVNEWTWNLFRKALEDINPDEWNWRPLPQANTINAIVRHLRIEAEWHLLSLEHEKRVSVEHLADSVLLDFEQNLRDLERLYNRFMVVLGEITPAAVRDQTAIAYGVQGGPQYPPDLLSFHQAVHLAIHLGQIRSIRNLYLRTQGKPGRFFPDNPTFPEEQR